MTKDLQVRMAVQAEQPDRAARRGGSRINATASALVAPIASAASTAPVSSRSVARSMRRSTLMNSRVPADPRSASRRRRRMPEALGQLPVPRAAGRSRARRAFARAVPGSDGGHRWCALSAPVTRVRGDELGAREMRDLLDAADHGHLVVGDRRSAPSSRCGRSARARASWPGAARPGAPRRTSAGSASMACAVGLQALGLGLGFAPHRRIEIGDATLLPGARSARRRRRRTAPGPGSSAAR